MFTGRTIEVLRMSSKRSLPTLMVVVALLLGACGRGEDEGAEVPRQDKQAIAAT